MIDLLTIAVALFIIIGLVGFFGYLAWKMNMSDLLYENQTKQQLEMINEKKKKDKNLNEQGKKKRKDQKKTKRETKDEEQQQRTKSKGPITQTSEETDDEREESEQEILQLNQQKIETSSTKSRKRNKNKTRSTTPPPPTSSSSLLKLNKDEKHPNTTRAPPVTHPKLTTKDENQTNKQQIKIQTTTTKVEKQPSEQPFTVVGANRHKNGPSTSQQQNKSQINVIPVQQTSSSQPQVQHEQLTQRQPISEKQTPIQNNSLPLKQQQQQQPKIVDLIKILPSSQVVVTELMAALDACSLSTDELDIIMHKIANKQTVVKQDWNKLHQGQKVNPQAHIGQIMDESAKSHENELINELNKEKTRYNDLLKEKQDKEREIEVLQAKVFSIQQHKNEPIQANNQLQNKIQTLELQLKRITEDNVQLNKQLTTNLVQTDDGSNLKFQVLSEQMKKLSLDNANLEKKVHTNELLVKEAEKGKENLTRYNEQLTKSLENSEKELKQIEEKYHVLFNETNELKLRIDQLETDNERLKCEDIVHVEPVKINDVQTLNDEQRENYEKEINQLKQMIDLNQQKEREYNDVKEKLIEEIEELKKNEKDKQKKIEETYQNELNALHIELDEVKSKSEENLRQTREKQRENLTNLLSQDVRNELPNENQDFDQWFSIYQQLFESNKKIQQNESEILKQENDQLHKNMKEIENQLKDIEKSVQSKEEILLNELKNKTSILEQIRNENEQLTKEIHRLQSAHDASVNETQALKHQLDERFLAAANSPQIVADESFELVKQSSPSLSPSYIDVRTEQLNELIRSSKEALENQDSVTQQLNKHLNEMQPSGSGETSTVSSTSHQES